MPEHTTTKWTCSRCGKVETHEGSEQPPNWSRVGFVTPPRGSWSDKVTILGDLCNDPLCGGLIVAFMHGEELTETERQRRMSEALARVGDHDG